MQRVSKIIQLKGRSGFYLRIPVPSDCRKALRTNGIQRKAGNTKQEAIKNRPTLLAKAEELFSKTRGVDPVSDAFTDPVVTEGHEAVDVLLLQRLEARGFSVEEAQQIVYGDEALKSQGITPPEPQPVTTALHGQAHARLEGGVPYTEWLTKRTIEERPAKTTQRRWTGCLKDCAEWFGTDYLGGMTQSDAANYKRHLQTRLMDSSVKTQLQCLKAFWSWAVVQGQLETNIWGGLTKKLQSSSPKEALDIKLLVTAKDLALQENDISFFIQYYTGCRRGEHRGLRFKDIDLKKGLIHIKEWQTEKMNRRLKGRKKDERTVPIHSELKAHLLKILPEALTNNSSDPIWPDSYQTNQEVWGATWGHTFGVRYGFNSHRLRSNVVSQLMMKNVSPFILYEITRHRIPGMSEVVAGYVRPSLDDVREVIERLD